jgi:hypothetical protein
MARPRRERRCDPPRRHSQTGRSRRRAIGRMRGDTEARVRISEDIRIAIRAEVEESGCPGLRACDQTDGAAIAPLPSDARERSRVWAGGPSGGAS